MLSTSIEATEQTIPTAIYNNTTNDYPEWRLNEELNQRFYTFFHSIGPCLSLLLRGKSVERFDSQQPATRLR